MAASLTSSAQLAPRKPRRTSAELDVDDAADLLPPEPMEHDDLVEAVDELGPESLRTHAQHRACAHLSLLLRRRDPAQLLAFAAISADRCCYVRMMTVFLKSTVRPWPSVSRPSSST